MRNAEDYYYGFSSLFRSHLPFCAQLKYYQYSGSFPTSFSDFPEILLEYLRGQLEFVEIEEYEWDGRTAKRHKLEILEYLDIRKSNDEDRTEYKEWLMSKLIQKISNIKELAARSEVWFLQHKLVLPTESTLERLIRPAIKAHEERIFEQTLINPPTAFLNELVECIPTRLWVGFVNGG